MTEAVKKTCEFVFNNSDIKNIYAFVFESNIASRRVLEKAGFIYERTLEKSIIKGGIAINAKVYCLSK